MEMNRRLVSTLCIWACMGFVALFLAGCQDDETGPASSADFSYEPDEENPMLIHFTNTSQNYHSSYWQFGDGSDHSTEDSPSHTFPGAGTYTIILAVQGEGTGQEIRREIRVIDPTLLGERIEDNNLQDEEAWTVYNGGNELLTQSTFTEEGLVLSNGDEDVESNVVIWQAFEVEGGKEYVFSAEVSGGGMHQSWLEFHLSDQEPEDGDDYSANNLYSMNTWAECGEDPFSGNIVEIGCAGDGESDGTIVFETGGTHYLVIKSGSWQGNLGPDGITISAISLMPADELD